jgi:hypothetical protein
MDMRAGYPVPFDGLNTSFGRRAEHRLERLWRARIYPTFPIKNGLTGAAIADRKTVNVGDVSADARL